MSFNPYRTLGIPGVTYIKPEPMFRQRGVIAAADWLIFPEYWRVNALTHGLGARLFPSPATYRIGHDKIERTRVLWTAVPELVPETLIAASTDATVDEILDRFALPFVVKEPRNSMERGVFLMESRSAFRDYAARHPVLYVQEYLHLPRDLRVVYVGDRVVAAYWRRGLQDFRNNVALEERFLSTISLNRPSRLSSASPLRWVSTTQASTWPRSTAARTSSSSTSCSATRH